MFDAYQTACKKCAPWGVTVLRVIVGILLIFHGYPKLFGDSAGLLAFFESTILPFPAFMLTLAGLLEFFGGIALVAGGFIKGVSTLLVLEFLVIILFVKLRGGFVAMQLDLLLLGALFALSSIGAGRLSADDLLAKYWKKKQHSNEHVSEKAST